MYYQDSKYTNILNLKFEIYCIIIINSIFIRLYSLLFNFKAKYFLIKTRFYLKLMGIIQKLINLMNFSIFI